MTHNLAVRIKNQVGKFSPGDSAGKIVRHIDFQQSNFSFIINNI
jgi:hypothetical protein